MLTGSRTGRVLRRAAAPPARSVRGEALLAGVGGLLLAVVMTWPALRHPLTTVPGDIVDPLAEAWIASWGGHALLHQPGHLFDSNTFFPLPNSYAFNDTLLGYAPLALLGGGLRAALLRYNVAFVGAYALAFVGAYALARQLGVGRTGAVVAGVAFAYAPWRLAQVGHLNILSSGGIPLALALLARGHGYGRDGVDRERARPGAAAASWAVAAWQLSLGFGLGLTFAYALLLVGVAALAGWLLAGRPWLPRRLVLTDALGGTGLVLVAGLLALPYLRVLHDHPEAARGAQEVALFSPPLSGFVTAPATDRLWSGAQAGLRSGLSWPPEMTMLPGFLLLALAACGLLAGAAPTRRRAWLALAVVATVLLGMGTRFAGGHWTILPMQAHLPGWQSVRTTGRLVVYTTLALGLLAGYGVDRMQRALTHRGLLVGRWALLALPALVLLEGVGEVPHPVPPPLPPAVAAARADGPLLLLPSDPVHDAAAMYWSTDGYPQIANGSTSVTPRQIEELRQRTAGFPDPSSVAYLRAEGVRTVVLLPGYAAGSPWQGAERRPVTGLGIARRQVGNDWVYELG